jgi:type VI secretion system secreted protein VgrG
MAEFNKVQIADLAQYVLSTGNRAIRLILDRASDNDNTSGQLLAQKVTGHEAICGGFEYRVLCVAESAWLPLKDFIGVPAELQIVTDRGQLRRLCGIVTAAVSGQSDGGLATYQLVMRDALSMMEHRVNTRIFRDMSELDIIETLIKEWQTSNPILAATFDLDIVPGLRNARPARREFTMQHNESDAAFIRRLMQRLGIAWFFRPGLPNWSGAKGRHADHALGHTLVLFKDPYCLRQNSAGTVRFHRDAATEQRDAITYWSAERTLQPGRVALYSPDYNHPGAAPFTTVHSESQVNQGTRGNQLAASLEDYYIAAPHLGDTMFDLTALGDAQMARFEYASKSFHGEGGVRDLAVGEWFILEGHPEIDTHEAKERQFVLTEQRVIAQNNLPVDISARVERMFNRNGWAQGDDGMFAAGVGEDTRYKTRFSCVRRGVRIVPPRRVLRRPQVQTAIVVGPPGEQVWCDKLGRVKVRFPAVRPQPNAHASGGDASNLDGVSAWVRVASNWAGNGPGSSTQCGARLLPPVGTEVLIEFAGGDPDKPVIVGQLYNADALPPAFRHEDALPVTRYQSGLRSREMHGHRGNQLRFDDTRGEISAQLASDHATTELNLGYLTELRQDGQAAPRGEGAELRTDEAIALHAARGIFLSAWKLFGGSGTKGRQLARDDFVDLLRECGELFSALGNYSAEHNGLPVDAKDQDELLTRFKRWESGSNTAPEAAEPREPVIGVTSPAGIGFASSKAIISYSAKNIDTVAQQHLQLTAGQCFAVNAGKGVSFFAHHGGLRAIAHFGKLVLQSQHDDTAIDSARNMQLTACDGVVTVSAKALHFVVEDGSFVRMGNGEFVIGSKNPIQYHAPDFLYDEPQTMTPLRPAFGSGGADQKAELRYPHAAAADEKPSEGGLTKDRDMEISLSDGTSMTARSGADGKSALLARDAMHMADIDLLGGDDK